MVMLSVSNRLRDRHKDSPVLSFLGTALARLPEEEHRPGIPY
jgi:hypothetical protein